MPEKCIIKSVFLKRMAPLFVVLAIFLLFGLFIRLVEPSLIYFPEKAENFAELHIGERKPQDVVFETDDGVKLHAWWIEPGDEMPVLLFCHGNAGNISHRAELLNSLAQRDLGVFIFDYRGYGRSEGSPSETGLYRDVTAAYSHLVNSLGIPSSMVYLFGKSLGGAVALDLAIRQPVSGLILESSFTNVRDMSRLMFGPIPAHWFARSRFDNLAKIRNLKVPLLVIHGEQDEVVPFKQGKRLLQAAPEPKFFYWVSCAGHNDVDLAGGEDYLDGLVKFVTETSNAL